MVFHLAGIKMIKEKRALNVHRDQIKIFDAEGNSIDKIKEQHNKLRNIEFFSLSFIHLEINRNNRKTATVKRVVTKRKSKVKTSPGLFLNRTTKGAIKRRYGWIKQKFFFIF